MYVRFQATVPNRRGTYPGVFALLNGLAGENRLTVEQLAFKQSGYEWFDANLTDPSTVDPSLYDRELHPCAGAWFKASAHEHIERANGYLEILEEHGVGCEAVWVQIPGMVLYEDEHQVVAMPEPISVEEGPLRRRGGGG